MDNRKLKVAPKVGQYLLVQGDEIVARIHCGDRRDSEEAENYAAELVRRWNARSNLVEELDNIHTWAANRDGHAEEEDNDTLRAKLNEALVALRAVWNSSRLSKQIALQNIDVVDGKIGPYEDPLTERVYQAIETLKA